LPSKESGLDSQSNQVTRGASPNASTHSSKPWQWILGGVGLLSGLELEYQTGIRLTLFLTLTAAMVGRTIDTWRIRHWLFFPLVILLGLSGTGLVPDPKAAHSFNRGVDALKSQDYGLAISCFSEAIELDPRNAQAYLNRGGAYAYQRKFDDAIADFTRAIRLDPRYLKAYISRSFVHNEKGQHKRAIADCNEALWLYPDCAEAFHNRGVAYERMGELANARADFDRAFRIKPNLGKK
jgi:tetratricopeptide (TPR) repeat protein